MNELKVIKNIIEFSSLFIWQFNLWLFNLTFFTLTFNFGLKF